MLPFISANLIPGLPEGAVRFAAACAIELAASMAAVPLKLVRRVIFSMIPKSPLRRKTYHNTEVDLSIEPPLAEAWMRGYLVGVDPVIAAVLYSLQQIREDVHRWTSGLTYEQIWRADDGQAPAGFHLRHMAGSIDRLTTYADAGALNNEQLTALRAEQQRDLSLEQMLEMLEAALVKAEALLRTTTPAEFGAHREIGRKRIPTTLAGLLIHTAEHSQRHLGAMIAAVKLVRARSTE